ncbi:hypothetical protein SAMN02799626_04882 [Caulobacter sp. UNC279MFTsu5.1]|nr:hypothetical protein SAMN02799626_04882 [Caulobacter sp. UNC279MFTsu5.1]
MKKYFKTLAIALGLATVAVTPAAAYTECTAKIASAFYSQEGYVWINLAINGATGGAIVVDKADLNREAYLSILLTARAQDKSVIFRLAKDNGACTATNYDLTGIWIP